MGNKTVRHAQYIVMGRRILNFEIKLEVPYSVLTRQAMFYERNNETRSRNHFCHVKARVSVALVIRPIKRLRCVLLYGVLV